MMQKIFDRSENAAVFVTVVFFIVFHFGLLFLFRIV